jgi:uncharacterized protein with GYD domain
LARALRAWRRARRSFEAVSARIKEFYMVMGQYDMVAIVEAPDDATFARALLTNTSKSGFQSETLRALTEAEYQKIISTIR